MNRKSLTYQSCIYILGPVTDELLKPERVAQMLGVKPATLTTWRYRGQGPEWVKLGDGKSSQVRYRRSVIEDWIRSHEVRRSA